MKKRLRRSVYFAIVCVITLFVGAFVCEIRQQNQVRESEVEMRIAWVDYFNASQPTNFSTMLTDDEVGRLLTSWREVDRYLINEVLTGDAVLHGGISRRLLKSLPSVVGNKLLIALIDSGISAWEMARVRVYLSEILRKEFDYARGFAVMCRSWVDAWSGSRIHGSAFAAK